jgi:hypothetical protein
MPIAAINAVNTMVFFIIKGGFIIIEFKSHFCDMLCYIMLNKE